MPFYAKVYMTRLTFCVCRSANGELLLPLCDFVVVIVYRSANGDRLASRTVILIDFVSVSANGDLLLSHMHFIHVVANFSFVSVSDLVTYVAFFFFVIAIYCLMIIIVNVYILGEGEVAIIGFQ